ncbi:MAG: 3-keto-disaccharide hydrolase [Aurantibacter sp.]
MKKYILLFGLSITLFSIISCAEKNISKEVLFQENGSDWFSQGDANWKFVDGELVGSLESGTGFVMTKKSYQDFVLELEFKPDSTINSGIFIRCKENEISNIDCYEINIWDLHPDQKSRTGAVVTRSTPLAKVETLDKWNSYKIKNEKEHLQVWINGILTADMKDQDLVEGPIALQAAEAGQIMFRNVRLTQID